MITEDQVRELIKEVTNTNYIGKIKIFKEDGYYCMQLFMQQYERPRITIGMETEDDATFLAYLKDELRSRALNIVKFWRLDKLDTDEYRTWNTTN